MQFLRESIASMIDITDDEFASFSQFCHAKTYDRHDIISKPGLVPNEIYFIVNGLIRVTVTDQDAIEHTIHFALENQFIADYSAFMQEQKSMYSLQTMEETSTIVLPREAIIWGYQNLKEGQKLGRLIAEFYFIYQDNRIKNLYARSPKERYDSISDVFPNIHNRVPQHMIASYLGISSVHLSRLKNKAYKKV
jgi:CRP-like cAMP-binding protein